jgi:hypothetical protein
MNNDPIILTVDTHGLANAFFANALTPFRH